MKSQEKADDFGPARQRPESETIKTDGPDQSPLVKVNRRYSETSESGHSRLGSRAFSSTGRCPLFGGVQYWEVTEKSSDTGHFFSQTLLN
jgi:hypothetical protein